MDERIMTLHPEPDRSGTRISRARYDQVRSAILSLLRARGEMGFTELVVAVEEAIGSQFDGSVPWYVTTVKLDLEARGLVRRVEGARPQRLALVL